MISRADEESQGEEPNSQALDGAPDAVSDPAHDLAHDEEGDGSRVDWRTSAGTVDLLVGNAMMGLEKVLFPEKRKADTEQVSDMPVDKDAPKLDYGDSGLDPLGPDDDGYWPV